MPSPHRSGPLGEITCVQGESFVISGPDGDVLPAGDHGFYVRDVRMLDRLEVLIDGVAPRPLAGRALDASRAVFHAWVPVEDAPTVDPTFLVTRHRVLAGSLHEEIVLENRGSEPQVFTLSVRCGTDLAYIFDVKHGRHQPATAPSSVDGRLVFRRTGGVERIVLDGGPGAEVHGDELRWDLRLPPGTATRCCIDAEATDVYATSRPLERCSAFSAPYGRQPDPPPQVGVVCSDQRMARLLRRSLEDLRSLQVSDPLEPSDRFTAAGSPWYLTLFGRDALWSAFMALPVGLEVAGGTLRTLARRQGLRDDQETEEEPGKILHEIRRGALAHRGDLPPNYYGTVDATPLFVTMLHEAWRWGLPTQEVASLLPAAESALGWLRDHGDPSGSGFVHYHRRGSRGLDNQGWKDSDDGVRFADGRLPQPPIALAEVQGYAHDAARRGAELLDAFGRPGADEWRTYATRLRAAFAARFWVEDSLGPYPAMALDGDGAPVDAPASNMGHLLSSGLLEQWQEDVVARRLGHPSLASGWGLRTMASTSVGYNPLAYHCGSVWPHDTAIAAWGCALAGQRDVAHGFVRGLVAVAPFFQSRLPELFSGEPRHPLGFPIPYPMACRPQAWAAAAALMLVRACLRPSPAIPDGHLRLAPLWPPFFDHLELADLPLGEGRMDVRVDARLGVDVEIRGSDVEVRVDTEAGRVAPY